MSWAAPSAERRELPDAIEAKVSGRKTPERLYWRLQRPGAAAYARRARRVLLYRVVSAVAAIVAIALCAFLGMILGNIGNPRWPPIARIGLRTINLAVVHALTEFASWMPVFIVLGVILAIIPRPSLWIFRLAMLGAGALGYCQRRLPPVHWSGLASAITERTAATVGKLSLRPPASPEGAAAVVLAAAIVAAYVGYRYS